LRTYELAGTNLDVSRIAQGCMRLSERRSEAVATIRAALDQGINLFDHADIYGGGRAEEAFAAIWQEVPGLRDRVIIQSKCGIRFAGDPDANAPERYDFSYEHIVRSVEGSLRRLRTDHLDILLLHRPDPLVEPEEVARAFDHLEESGKVRYFGVSNHNAAQIELLQAYLSQPLVVNQLELNLLHTHLIEGGIVSNQDEPPRVIRGDGTLEYCRLHNIRVQSWAPMARGIVSGRAMEGMDPRVARTAEAVAALAAARGVSPTAIVIAWLLRHPAGIQPIIGTTQPARIKAACEADRIELTREEWYRLFIAGRGSELP